jgi:prepilin-type N-terminal cleavage/methylation domain-containing protein
MKTYLKNHFNSSGQRGQTLLFVVVAMTIALALGIGIATRTMSSLSRTTRSDTADRVRSVAEGGIERLLRQSSSVLNGGIDSTECTELDGYRDGNNSSYCDFDFPASPTDPIAARAKVLVTDFAYNAPGNMYRFTLEKDSLTEINVAGVSTNLRVCWNGNVDLYYILYGSTATTGTVKGKEGILTDMPTPPYDVDGFDKSGIDGSAYGYDWCVSDVAVPADSKYLRIRALKDDAIVAVGKANGDALPNQGHRIESIGELLNDDGSVRTQKRVLVSRSYPFLPAPFDFGVYSDAGWTWVSPLYLICIEIGGCYLPMITFKKEKDLLLQTGFTLVELMIVIVILGILSGAVIAVINPTRQQDRARMTAVRSTVEKACIGLHACSAYASLDTDCDSWADIGTTPLPATRDGTFGNGLYTIGLSGGVVIVSGSYLRNNGTTVCVYSCMGDPSTSTVENMTAAEEGTCTDVPVH